MNFVGPYTNYRSDLVVNLQYVDVDVELSLEISRALIG